MSRRNNADETRPSILVPGPAARNRVYFCRRVPPAPGAAQPHRRKPAQLRRMQQIEPRFWKRLALLGLATALVATGYYVLLLWQLQWPTDIQLHAIMLQNAIQGGGAVPANFAFLCPGARSQRIFRASGLFAGGSHRGGGAGLGGAGDGVGVRG